MTVAEEEAAARVIRSGWLTQGPVTQEFEGKLAAYTGAKRVYCVSSCTTGLFLALRSLGIGPGDEVVVPSNTYIATWLAVSYTGAVPVPVEPDDRTYNMDPHRIEAVITGRTKAILPVHLYGQPADMDLINGIASRYMSAGCP